MVAFLFDFTTYSIWMKIRIIRSNFLALLISSEHHTSLLSIHQLMATTGAILGSLIQYIAQLWNGEVQLYLSQSVLIDHFFIVQTSTGLMIVIAIIVFFTVFRNKEKSTRRETPNPQRQEEQPLFSEYHPEDSEEGVSS